MTSRTDDYKVERIIFNDTLGYAIAYYKPVTANGIVLPQREESCGHERHGVLTCLQETLEDKFVEEIETMVRRREREDASKAIEKICAKVHDLYNDVEESERKGDREVLNFRVREQIKGKSANEICDILVQDVLAHTKVVRSPREDLEMKRKPTTKPKDVKSSAAQALEDEETNRRSKVFERIEKLLDEDIQSDVHHRKYSRLLSKMQDDLVYLKRRCTEKITFPY